MSQFRILLFVFLCSVVLPCDGTGTRFPDGDSRFSSFYADGWEYRVSDEKWDVDRRGNHRAVVYVNAGDAPAVRAVIPWRRPDLEPESKMMIVTDATGREINNVLVRDICSESGTIIFQPVYGNGALIDLHSNRKYSVCPANQYAEFFPYVDRLWFGEFFRYDEMTAEEWLVTASGIPFGLTSDMLQGGGNRYLEMLFGSTARLAYKLMPAEEYLAKVFGPDSQPSYDKLGADNVLSPVPIWNFLDRIGIKDMEMTGFWDPECPVKASDSDVKATVYSRDGKTLISVGNFSNQDKSVRLEISGQGLSAPDRSVLHAPAIRNFQEEASFGIGDGIPLKAKGRWLFLYK